jgi:FkbM family methyltransferase
VRVAAAPGGAPVSDAARPARSPLRRALGRLRRTLWPTTFERSHRRWLADRGDATLRLDYPLGPGAVVLDVGGYVGEWAGQVLGRFGCTVHVFEPLPEFAEVARQRLAGHERAVVHAYGLAARTRVEPFTLAADGSSALRGGGGRSVPLRAAAEVFDELALGRVDLMKVNIEGGEYELIEHLIDRGLIGRIEHLQVQFHDFVPGAAGRMRALQRRLAATHALTWQYPFVWESWRRRSDRPRAAAPATL